jgi:hypothetical protein
MMKMMHMKRRSWKFRIWWKWREEVEAYEDEEYEEKKL